MNRALLLLPLLLTLACGDKPSTGSPPAAPAPVVKKKALKVTEGLLLKMLGAQAEKAGMKLGGAPLIDGPAWAKPRAENGAILLEDPKTRFRIELTQQSTFETARDAVRKSAAERAEWTVTLDEPDALVVEKKAGDQILYGVYVDAAAGEPKEHILCMNASAPEKAHVEVILKSCRSYRYYERSR
jgi:hypothetical protein